MAHRYAPMYRPMGSYMMSVVAPGLDWTYVEAARMWPLSPLPPSRHLYGVIETEEALSPAQIARLELKPV